MVDQQSEAECKTEPFDLTWTLQACPHDEPPVVLTKTSKFGWFFIFISMGILGFFSFLLMPLAFIGLIFRDKFIYCSQCGKFLEIKPKFRIQGLPKFYKEYYG